MAAKRVTAGDVVMKLFADFNNRASRAKRFAVLDRRPAFRPPTRPSTSRPDEMVTQEEPHRAAMWRLLLERYAIKRKGELTKRDLERLLGAVLRDYVPAFGWAPLARGRGRPRTGITDRQIAAIDRAVAVGQSVRSKCLELTKTAKQATAIAAAYHRETKRRDEIG